MLYLTGYLTRADSVKGFTDNKTALVIPNAEIREIFETTIIKWFQDSAKTWKRNELFEAVWNGDSETITKEMNMLLRRTISYHDYREDFYHAFLAGIFAGSFILERMFAIPGLGFYYVKAVSDNDYTMVIGLTIFFAILFVGSLIVVDILYGIVDPRIRVAKGKK